MKAQHIGLLKGKKKCHAAADLHKNLLSVEMRTFESEQGRHFAPPISTEVCGGAKGVTRPQSSATAAATRHSFEMRMPCANKQDLCSLKLEEKFIRKPYQICLVWSSFTCSGVWRRPRKMALREV